jgi:hypothetical protein
MQTNTTVQQSDPINFDADYDAFEQDFNNSRAINERRKNNCCARVSNYLCSFFSRSPKSPITAPLKSIVIADDDAAIVPPRSPASR